MKKKFIEPQFIRITQYCKYTGSGNTSNLTDGSVHEVIQQKEIENQENALFVQGVSQPVRLFADEYSCLWPTGKNGKPQVGKTFTEEEIEAFRKEFEKNQQESKKNTKFVPTVNSKTKMSKTSKTAVTEKGSLTATEMQVMEAIIAQKTVNAKKADIKMIGKVADLDEVDSALSGIDAAKVCRKMKRSGLLSYEWSTDKEGNRTGAREVGITKEGFEALQLPVKVKAAPGKKKEQATEESAKDAPKASKKSSKEQPKKQEPFTAPGEEAETEEDDLLGDTDFAVKINAKDKSFTVVSTYGEHKITVKTLKEFKELKEETQEGWLTRIENGELDEL